jgi:N,N-dimethylformamidase
MDDIVGYLGSVSVKPGDQQTVMANCSTGAFNVELVRLRGPRDRFGATDWYTTEPVADLTGKFPCPGTVQRTMPGSLAYAPEFPSLPHGGEFTVATWVWPTRPTAGRRQTLLSQIWPDLAGGWRLVLDGAGTPILEMWSKDGEIKVEGPTGLTPRLWHGVAASVSYSAGTVSVFHFLPAGRAAESFTSSVYAGWLPALPGADAALSLAATLGPLAPAAVDHHDCYDGKLDQPTVWQRALPVAEIQAIFANGAIPVDAAACWRFSPGRSGVAATDLSGNGRVLRTVNLPTSAVTDHSWSGSFLDWRCTPKGYGAMYFRSDDLANADWTPSLEFQVPRDLPSGVYAVAMTSAAGRDDVPFYVRRSESAPAQRVLFLAPTLTYLAYANDRQHAQQDFSDVIAGGGKPGATEAWLDAHPEMGLSLYDRHLDGSGCISSSRLRPTVTIRPGYVSWLTGAPRHFSADLAILSWLDNHGCGYDVCTDEDLHVEGAAGLAPYQVVVTGSHPEYWTEPMITALERYVDSGGKVMYLGGNGFYWVTGLDVDSGIIEVRRGNAGTGTSESAPGEAHLASTGEPGGLWRHRGRPPQQLVGVGFTAQGWGPGSSYVIAADVPEAIHRAVFGDLPPGTRIGAGGVLGGAAGDEIDRLDNALGTPPQSVLLATARGFTDHFQPTVEDQLSIQPGLGGAENPDVRADIVYLPAAGGGAVFSVGSINWAMYLPDDGFGNDVAAVSSRVLDAFLRDEL